QGVPPFVGETLGLLVAGIILFAACTVWRVGTSLKWLCWTSALFGFGTMTVRFDLGSATWNITSWRLISFELFRNGEFGPLYATFSLPVGACLIILWSAVARFRRLRNVACTGVDFQEAGKES